MDKRIVEKYLIGYTVINCPGFGLLRSVKELPAFIHSKEAIAMKIATDLHGAFSLDNPNYRQVINAGVEVKTMRGLAQFYCLPEDVQRVKEFVEQLRTQQPLPVARTASPRKLPLAAIVFIGTAISAGLYFFLV